MISMCVGMNTSLLRDPGSGGCRPSMEFSIQWSASSVAPQMCINTSTRFLSLATSGKCLFKGTVAAKPNRPNKFFACAQNETGFLRWPITGKCLTTNTPVRYLAVPLEPKAPATTTLVPSTTTTTSTSTTTIPEPVSYSPPTGTTTTTTSSTSTSSTTSTSTTVALAAPAFTLSSSSESKAQNTAITGYTISSTGGVITSYSISPSAPAGTSFNTSTGLLSGTPTTVQSATTYTITATNATSSTTQTFALTVTLAAPAESQPGHRTHRPSNTRQYHHRHQPIPHLPIQITQTPAFATDLSSDQRVGGSSPSERATGVTNRLYGIDAKARIGRTFLVQSLFEPLFVWNVPANMCLKSSGSASVEVQ